jgi:hypothetical protein
LIPVGRLYTLMDKFTLLELHVHDGMEFSATNTAPAIGRSGEEADVEELEATVAASESDADAEGDAGTDLDGESDAESDSESDSDAGGRSPGPLGLLVGLLVVALLAVAVRKLRGGDADLEVAELDDLAATGSPDDEEAAEH